jgi:predicted transposase YbfD/YdcC
MARAAPTSVADHFRRVPARVRRTRRHALVDILVITLCAIHRVSAWATAQGLCLGRVKTDTKSSEVTAMPILLDLHALAGRIVTTDAMGCHTAIARRILAHGGDDVLSLKGNQTRVHDDIKAFVADAESWTSRRHVRHVETRRPRPGVLRRAAWNAAVTAR